MHNVKTFTIEGEVLSMDELYNIIQGIRKEFPKSKDFSFRTFERENLEIVNKRTFKLRIYFLPL